MAARAIIARIYYLVFIYPHKWPNGGLYLGFTNIYISFSTWTHHTIYILCIYKLSTRGNKIQIFIFRVWWTIWSSLSCGLWRDTSFITICNGIVMTHLVYYWWVPYLWHGTLVNNAAARQHTIYCSRARWWFSGARKWVRPRFVQECVSARYGAQRCAAIDGRPRRIWS